jgi:hypothetical protein
MSTISNQPSNIPAGAPDDGTQLGLLLNAAQDMLAEESRRTDRLESRARHMSTVCGALFAVVTATTVGVLNALLTATDNKLAGWVVPVVGGLAIVSGVFTAITVAWALGVQRLRNTAALDPDSFDAYVPYAEKGNVAVAKRLITAYTELLRSRRNTNNARADDLDHSATPACVIAVVASVAQFAAVFVALLSN